MGNYVQSNLNNKENIVKQATINKLCLLPAWIGAIIAVVVLSYVTGLLAIDSPAIMAVYVLFVLPAVMTTIRVLCIELAITNRRVIGKTGVVNTNAMDAPLDKVQNVSVSRSLWGHIFNYGSVRIDTAAGKYDFKFIKSAEDFKRVLMDQIEQTQEEKMRQQAEEMAKAMSSAMKS